MQIMKRGMLIRALSGLVLTGGLFLAATEVRAQDSKESEPVERIEPAGEEGSIGSHDTSFAQPPSPQIPWTEVEVEHLLNRAAFGASNQAVRRWKKAGHAALIEHLFSRGGPAKAFRVESYRIDRAAHKVATSDERQQLDRELRQKDRLQIHNFGAWWFQEMIRGRDPLRERMTLILHGWLVSSNDKVRQSDYLIQQNELFRQNALGNYGYLLRKILEDPAMLLYLDNNTNRRGKPNENLARELLELFSLGEGNYSESDIRQAARALTGYTVRQDGFYYNIRQHDPAFKTVLGKSSRMAADGLIAVILKQPACAEYVAHRLILEFEGIEPDPDRLFEYAELLREQNYEFEPFLRTLFSDPAFFRSEVIGTKILSPVEFMAGHCRRLQIQPDYEILYSAAGALGQTVLRPPSVKGWDGGFAWLTESSLMLRSNVWGALLGEISGKELREQVTEAIAQMDEMMGEMMEEAPLDSGQEVGQEPKRRGGPLNNLLGAIQKRKLVVDVPILSRLQKRRAFSDKAIANYLLDELLAIDAPESTRAALHQYIKQGRKRLKIQPGKLHKGGQRAKKFLLGTIHIVLSLPEAQLG